jgi:hypothetical protein
MSHQVQLSPVASHAAKPSARRSRCPPLSRPHMRRIVVPPWKSALHDHRSQPAKDSRASPGQYGRTGPHGPTTVPPLSAHRPDFPEEGSGAKTPRATGAPYYMTSHPASDLLASKGHDRDRPLRYPRATGHRPPVDPHRHQAQAGVAALTDKAGKTGTRRSPAFGWRLRGGPAIERPREVHLRPQSVSGEDVAAILARRDADESSYTALATVDRLWSNM